MYVFINTQYNSRVSRVNKEYVIFYLLAVEKVAAWLSMPKEEDAKCMVV